MQDACRGEKKGEPAPRGDTTNRTDAILNSLSNETTCLEKRDNPMGPTTIDPIEVGGGGGYRLGLLPGAAGFVVVLEGLKEVSMGTAELTFPQMHLATTFW